MNDSTNRCEDRQMMTSIRHTALIAMLGAGLARPVLAQSESQDPEIRLRNNCRLAQQTLTTGHPNTKMEWALGIITQCPGDEAAGTLAGLWSNPPADSTLSTLVAQTRSYADRRVLSAVLAAASDAGRPMGVRRAALNAAVGLFDARASFGDDFWANPARTGIGLRTHSFQKDGVQPLTIADRDGIIATLERIGSSDADPTVRTVAATLARELTLLRQP